MTEGIRILAPPSEITHDQLCRLADARARKVQPLLQLFTLDKLGSTSVPAGGTEIGWEPISHMLSGDTCNMIGLFDAKSVKRPNRGDQNEIWLYGISRSGSWILVCLHMNPAGRQIDSVEVLEDPFNAQVNAELICIKLKLDPVQILRFTNKICIDFADRLERKQRRIQRIKAEFEHENTLIDIWQGRHDIWP